MSVLKVVQSKAAIPERNVNSDESVQKAKTPSKKVLDEETYTEELERIIQRDFFPDRPKLKAQLEYVEAVENNDVLKLREIMFKYRQRSISRGTDPSLSSLYNTPSTFETPLVENNKSPTSKQKQGDSSDSSNLSHKQGDGNESLDSFLNKHTSEDNASFATIMEEAAKRHKEQYSWLYKDEDKEQKKMEDSLALPSSEESRPAGVLTWTYKNQNSLMYVPEGAEFTEEEKLQYEKRQEVVYTSTRFRQPPFNENANKAVIAEAASAQAKTMEGKVGIDGKEIITQESPQVNGYGFVHTPSPAPGITDSPIMTWGEIEGTPFLLDGSDTPLPQTPGGPHFKIPAVPARERLAITLADKAAKQHRTKKQDALDRMRSSILSPLSRFGSGTPKSPLDRLNSMSPAAQKLACSKLGLHRSVDKALRASYSPSPVHSPASIKTPVLLRTPQSAKSNVNSVTPLSSEDTPGKHRQEESDLTSLTDNLLNLPKRAKAADFF